MPCRWLQKDKAVGGRTRKLSVGDSGRCLGCRCSCRERRAKRKQNLVLGFFANQVIEIEQKTKGATDPGGTSAIKKEKKTGWHLNESRGVLREAVARFGCAKMIYILLYMLRQNQK